jgi:hypothetical protein
MYVLNLEVRRVRMQSRLLGVTRGLLLVAIPAGAYGVELHLRQTLQSLLQVLSLTH